MHTKTVLFVGKPGSGKETQAELLAKKTGFEIFSTGREFRRLKEESSPLGMHVRETYEKGLLMPAWLASYLFQSALLHKRDEEGVIFEGTGRRLTEAELFHEVATWLGRSYAVVNLDISDDEAVKRQVGRGRADSNTEEKVRTRLKEYDDHTAPVIDFFKKQKVLIEVRGEGTIEQIHADVLSRLGV